jgi:hypothetical protein
MKQQVNEAQVNTAKDRGNAISPKRSFGNEREEIFSAFGG